MIAKLAKMTRKTKTELFKWSFIHIDWMASKKKRTPIVVFRYTVVIMLAYCAMQKQSNQSETFNSFSFSGA